MLKFNGQSCILYLFSYNKKAEVILGLFFVFSNRPYMVCPAASHFIFLLRMISRITRSPSRISIPCRRGSPPLVRCSASHSVRMRTQRKPAASKADPISDRSLRLEAQHMRGIAASMRPMCSMQFFIEL